MDNASIPNTRYIWPFRARDTSLRCLYHIYEHRSADFFKLDTQSFWDQTSWKMEDIPDQNDPDPVRYAVLAGFAEAMAIASTSGSI
jgi:hypothetical protein